MPWSATFDRRYTPFFFFLPWFSYSSPFHFFHPIFQRFDYGLMSIHYYLLLFIWKFSPRLRDMEAGTIWPIYILQFTRFVMAEYKFYIIYM